MQSAVRMEKIYKTYQGGITALRGADFSLDEGEIHALVGENAAGKTTLMNILYGLVKPDKGNIYIHGRKKIIPHPKYSISYGIGMVHQHFMLVPDFTVLENIILGNEKSFIGHGWNIHFGKAKEVIKDLLKKLDIDVALDKVVNELSIGLQQKVEILKALFRGVKILVLDEPTTVLAPNEIDSFLDFLKMLRRRGTTIVFISHRLKEVFKIADRITILRRGKTITTLKTNETSMEEVSDLMIGRRLEHLNSRSESVSTKKVLELKNVSLKDDILRLKSISFCIREGEILGIAGVGGNGQSELAEIIVGLKKSTNGDIWFNGENIDGISIFERRKKGIRYVPDDRIKVGLSLSASIVENSIMGYSREPFLKKGHFTLNWKEAIRFSQKLIDVYGVKGIKSPLEETSNLSGGNMQKLLVGREFISSPKLLVISQPTMGLDVGAQFSIHKKILELSRKGTAILLISEDLDELMALSNRILVLYRGKIVKEFLSKEGYDDKEIGYWMTGVKGIA